MPVPALTVIGTMRRSRRARLYPEEYVIALIVVVSWIDMLRLIS